MYKMNKKGPRVEPCCTPCDIVRHAELTVFTCKHCTVDQSYITPLRKKKNYANSIFSFIKIDIDIT